VYLLVKYEFYQTCYC